VFVSYRHEDAPLVTPLVDYLRQQGFKIWIDAHDLLDPAEWQQSVRAAIAATDAVLVAHTEKAADRSGAAHLEWIWLRRLLEGNGLSSHPIVLAHFGHRGAPLSYFIDLEPTVVDSDADYPAVRDALTKAISIGPTKRQLDFTNTTKSARSTLGQLIDRIRAKRGYPGASRWRDPLVYVALDGVSADLLGERKVRWQGQFVGAPPYSVVEDAVTSMHPFAFVRDDGDRLGYLGGLIADLSPPRSKVSWDNLLFPIALELPDDQALPRRITWFGSLLLQSLRERAPVRADYERAFPASGSGAGAAYRFRIGCVVMPCEHAVLRGVPDAHWRKQLAATIDWLGASPTTAGESAGDVAVLIAYHREDLVSGRNSALARVGTRLSEQLRERAAREDPAILPAFVFREDRTWRI
jgi:hypothetical protein